MKSKTMILMVVAVACGLGASYMTSRLLAERGEQKQAEEEKIKILVARKNIPQGTYIKAPEEWFVEKEFTLGEEPKKAVRSFDEVKDRVLSKPLSAEQWVIADDLLTKTQSGLAYSLPKGMRAMAIKVNVDTVVAGFVQPNSRVDVLNTVRSGDKDSYSRTILQNMLVLAIDSIDSRDLEKKAIVSSTVTLAVTPEEAQALSMGQHMGELRLVLRPPDDTEILNLKGTKPEDVKNAQAKSAKQPGADDEPEGPKSPLTRVPDVPLPDPMGTASETAPAAEQPKPRKKHTLIVWNGDSQTKAVYLEGDPDDYEAQIQKSEADPRPEKASAPAQPTPGPGPAPAPEKPKPAKRQGGK